MTDPDDIRICNISSLGIYYQESGPNRGFFCFLEPNAMQPPEVVIIVAPSDFEAGLNALIKYGSRPFAMLSILETFQLLIDKPGQEQVQS